MIRGPRSERSMSTPATFKSRVLAAFTAVRRSDVLSLVASADPPLCRLDRNSPGAPVRFMAATTRSPTTNALTSVPPASLMNSCTRMFASSCRKASMTDSAAFRVSASTTPRPCVPSRSLTMRGAPCTASMTSWVSFTERAKAVTGRPSPARDSSWRARSLSRERVMAWDSADVNTPIISN